MSWYIKDQAFRMILQPEHTEDKDPVTDDPANGAHQGSTDGPSSFQWVSNH